MPVLYRKYRPQTFSEVVGQQAIIRTLQNAVSSGGVAHAYLFTGSRGVGKTSVARILAKAMNCLHGKAGDADNKCEICVAISNNNFLDLVEIDAASNTGVENVRELIEHVKFQPSLGKFKVFIIDEVHMLSKAAFNALLKTLEEPPAHAIFILATTDIQKVPETIISRTQRFDFRKITEQQIFEHLTNIVKQEKLGLSPEVTQLISTSAQGSLRDALSLLDKVAALGTEVTLAEAQSLLGVTSIKLSEQLLQLIAAKKAGELPALFDQLLSTGTDFSAWNRDLLEYLRKMLVAKVTANQADLDLLAEERQTLNSLAAQFSLPEIMHLVRLFLRSYKELTIAPTPELPLLLAALEAATGKTSTPVETAVTKTQTASAANSLVTQPGAGTAAKIIKQEIVEQIEEHFEPVSQEEVNAFWPAVIEQVKTLNSPLATLLRNSPIQEVVDSTINLSVKYLFHKEHLESKKNYALISQAITEVSGKKVRLAVKIGKTDDNSVFSDGLDAVGSALKVFGGELVE